MPVKLSQIKSPTKELDITYPNGVTLKIKYKPSAFTPLFAQQIAEMDKKGFVAKEQVKPILELLEGWDLRDDDENEVPINEETFVNLEYPIVRPIMEGILNDVSPNDPKGTQ